MKTVGLITEYNPFHNGHAYHLEQAKKITGSDHAVVVMSGNFTQRGEPAIADKFARASMALAHGADVVLELPVYYATASAEFFAYAAVKLLDSAGIAESICFGSESADILALRRACDILSDEPQRFKTELKSRLKEGMPYPVARAAALGACGVSLGALSGPNDILALEYCRALKKTGSAMVPYALRRVGADYHAEEITGRIASATAVRAALRRGELDAVARTTPERAYDILNGWTDGGRRCADISRLSRILQYALITRSPERLRETLDIGEGLENRIAHCAQKNLRIDRLAMAVKSKRYTMTRIRRALLHILLDVTKSEFEYFMQRGGPQYIRVLGFRRDKAYLLGEIARSASLPLLTNLKHAQRVLNTDGLRMLEKELTASAIYGLTLPGNGGGRGGEYRMVIE